MSQPPKTDKDVRPRGNSQVKSAVRTLTLFEIFAQHLTPLSLSELARALGIPLSSCHGLVGTLQAEGYLYSVGERRQYYPTRRLFDLATAITGSDPTLERLVPYLESLRDDCNETVILGTRQGHSVLYLNVTEGNQTIRYSASPGDRKPLHSSAIGKALLAYQGKGDLAAMLDKMEWPRITPSTIVERDLLVADLETGLKQGAFVTRGENVADVWAVAGVLTISGETLGLAIAGPAHRMEKDLDEHIKNLARCRETITADFRPDPLPT